MSKNNKTSAKFSYTCNQQLPALGKYPTNWDLKTFYYMSPNDPQIEKDVVATERAYKKFVNKYKNSEFKTSEKVLFNAFEDLNKLSENPVYGKATRYLALLTALNSGNEAATNKLNLLGQRLTKAGNDLLFFSLGIAQLPKSRQKELLSSSTLTKYTYELEQLFESAKHQLDEKEEKILRQLGICSYDLWVEMTEKMLGKKVLKYKNQEIPVNSAFEYLNKLSFSQRPKFWYALMDEIDSLKQVVEAELTAICTKKKITDDLRGYEKPYSASVIAHEDDLKSVEALIEAVSTRGFKLSRRFYSIKAKLHGVKKLEYAQRTASIDAGFEIPFADATKMCRDVFYGVNPLYGQIFDRLLTNGQIDVYPAKGKRGGAFCWGETGQPTNVFLNQADTLGSAETYAHEMGHAIHTERSKEQPAHYQAYSTTTAETASTFFEGLLFDSVLEQAEDNQKIYLLHEKISRNISTIQRQIAFHNFELEMHEYVRKEGAITHEVLNKMMQKHLKSYCGPAVNITKKDGNTYIYIGHFRYGFYVYTYTFGILMSSLMIESLKRDGSYRNQIDQFLTAGGSDTVHNIFKNIGFNTRKIDTFTHGLDKMEQEIKTLEKLVKKH